MLARLSLGPVKDLDPAPVHDVAPVRPPLEEGLRELPAAECWARLERHSLGRLAIVVLREPYIFPVTYTARAGAIAFRTGPGTKLNRGPGSPACFEVDFYDPIAEMGWSVVARGVLRDISQAEDPLSQELRALRLAPAAPGYRPNWMAIEVNTISGRAFGHRPLPVSRDSFWR